MHAISITDILTALRHTDPDTLAAFRYIFSLPLQDPTGTGTRIDGRRCGASVGTTTAATKENHLKKFSFQRP